MQPRKTGVCVNQERGTKNISPAERNALDTPGTVAGLAPVDGLAASGSQSLWIDDQAGLDAIAAENRTFFSGSVIDLHVDVIARERQVAGGEIVIRDRRAVDIWLRDERGHLRG